MVPLCDHVYVPVHPHPMRKNHIVVSVSIFLTVLPGLAAWRNPSLIPLWSKQWEMFVRWWHSMFSLGYKFSELLSRLRMKLWSVDKVCPSGLPKFAYQDLRIVGYIYLVRETLVSVGTLKSLSVSSVCGNNLWGKMMKKQIWIGWIWEDSLETLSLNLGWEKDIWGGRGEKKSHLFKGSLGVSFGWEKTTEQTIPSRGPHTSRILLTSGCSPVSGHHLISLCLLRGLGKRWHF